MCFDHISHTFIFVDIITLKDDIIALRWQGYDLLLLLLTLTLFLPITISLLLSLITISQSSLIITSLSFLLTPTHLHLFIIIIIELPLFLLVPILWRHNIFLGAASRVSDNRWSSASFRAFQSYHQPKTYLPGCDGPLEAVLL